MIYLIQHFEADFLWKVSLKNLNSGIILKTFTHVVAKDYISSNIHTARSNKKIIMESNAMHAIFEFDIRCELSKYINDHPDYYIKLDGRIAQSSDEWKKKWV